MNSLPNDISGYYSYKSIAPSEILLSKYKQWLFTVCYEIDYEIINAIKGIYPSIYHIINVRKQYGNKYSVLCNIYYPYIAFVDFQEKHFMPSNFIDLLELSNKLAQLFPEVIIIKAEILNKPAMKDILEKQPRIIKRQLDFWDNIYGRIIFNDFT